MGTLGRVIKNVLFRQGVASIKKMCRFIPFQFQVPKLFITRYILFCFADIFPFEKYARMGNVFQTTTITDKIIEWAQPVPLIKIPNSLTHRKCLTCSLYVALKSTHTRKGIPHRVLPTYRPYTQGST